MRKPLKIVSSFLPTFVSFYRSLAILFLLFFLIAGVIFTTLMPAFRAPDEPAHWQSAVSRISGKDSLCNIEFSLFEYLKTINLIGKKNLSIETGRFRKIEGLEATCPKVHVWYGNKFTYYGATVGVLAIENLVKFKEKLSAGQTALLKYFSARFLQGFLLACLLMRLIYRNWQEKSELLYPGTVTLLCLSLFPLFLQQSYSITSDTIILAACIALVTVQSYKTKIPRIDLLIAIFLALQAMITKPVYAPAFVLWALAAFIFEMRDNHLLGKNQIPKLKDLKDRDGFIFIAGMLAASFYVVWHFLTLPKGEILTPSSLVNPSGQLAFIKSDVSGAISIVVGTLTQYFALERFWEPLGWFDFDLSRFGLEWWTRIFELCLAIDSFFIVLLLVCALFQQRNSWKTLTGNLLVICLVLGGIYLSAVAVSLSMYIYWTPVGATYVNGIQARYFLPLIILCIGLLKMIGKGLTFDTEKIELGAVATRATTTFYTIVLVIFSFNTLFFLLSIVVDALKRYY